MFKYRPVVFLAGGEDGVCGGRFFDSRPTRDPALPHFSISEAGKVVLYARNLGEIRDGIEALVNS